MFASRNPPTVLFVSSRYSLVHVLPAFHAHRRRLLLAAGCMLAVLALWLVFVCLPLGQVLDTLAMANLGFLNRFDGPSMTIVGAVISTPALAIITIAVCLIAVVRRRWQLVARVVAIFGGANVTTQLLKCCVLSRSNYLAEWATPPSLPSGHTTAATTIAMAIIIVVPSRYRPFATALGAAWVSFVGLVILINGWHRPSDLVAAVLVTAAWAAVFAPSEVGRVWGVPLRAVFLHAGSILTASGILAFASGALVARRAGIVPSATTRIFALPINDHRELGMWLAAGGVCLFVGVVLLAMRGIDAKRHVRQLPPGSQLLRSTAPTAR